MLENLPFSENVFAVSRKKKEVEKKLSTVNEEPKTVTCPYKGILRKVFTSTCLWHRQENDPECFTQKCARVALKK